MAPAPSDWWSDRMVRCTASLIRAAPTTQERYFNSSLLPKEKYGRKACSIAFPAWALRLETLPSIIGEISMGHSSPVESRTAIWNNAEAFSNSHRHPARVALGPSLLSTSSLAEAMAANHKAA